MWYSYAVVRVVPRVERGEYVNVGVVLYSSEAAFLAVRIELPAARLEALAPGIDLVSLNERLRVFCRIADGDPTVSAIASLPDSDRFHWLTAPRSTVIQTSPVHVGRTSDPEGEIERLMDEFVRTEPAHDERTRVGER